MNDESLSRSRGLSWPSPDACTNARQDFWIVNAGSERTHTFSRVECCPRPSAQFRLNTLHWDHHHELHRLQNLQLFILMLSPNEDGLRPVHGVPTLRISASPLHRVLSKRGCQINAKSWSSPSGIHYHRVLDFFPSTVKFAHATVCL